MARFAALVPKVSARPRAWLLTAALLGASTLASAQAYTDSALMLRLGPGTDWTIVTELPPSTFVRIIGCDPRYRWCQVSVPHGLQGWLPGDGLRDIRDDQALRRDGQGSLIDFPVIVFTGIQFGQPIVPGAAMQRNDGTRHTPPRPPVAASAPRGGEREPVVPGRGGPR